MDQVDGDPMEDQPESFYTRYDDENNDITHSDKGFEEIAVNFVGIDASCSKCRAIFPSKSKLHTYLKDDCREVALLFLLPVTTSSIPIIIYKALHRSFDSRLAFRGRTYATTNITFTSEYLSLDLNLL